MAIRGTENHVHLLISLSENMALGDIMMTLKKDSSKWQITKEAPFHGFHWQDGYGTFSIGESQVRAVTDCIQRWKEHHQPMTFEEELVALANRNGVAFDAKFLWT